MHLKKVSVDMTSGSIYSHLISFAVPLLLGNLFQQLYNTVDTWVVGNFVGKVAFSAVGTLGSTVNMFIGFFSGLSSGAGVVISHFFGAKDYENVQKTTHTYFLVTIILCLVFTALGSLMVPLALKILNSPAEVAQQQSIYLKIYFAGVSGLLIYNMGAAMLRAIGNSTLPFIFLVVTTVLNTALDLLFVIKFNLGTAGVAYATILAQAVSAVLVVISLFTTPSVVKISLSKMKIWGRNLMQIIKIGIPSALQMSITSFSNVFVQSYINFFGTDVMGGWTAYSKLDQLFFLPMQSIDVAVTTFVGQNLGGKNITRARQGVKNGLLLSFASTVTMVLPVCILAPSIVPFFIDAGETGVIHYGSLFLRLLGPFFIVSCVHHIFMSGLKGCGKSGTAMVITLSCFVAFRQLYLYVVTNYISNTPVAVVFGYPAGWILCAILSTVAYIILFPKEAK